MFPKYDIVKQLRPLKDVNIVKVAVQFDEHPNSPQLIGIDQRQSLDEIIRDLCHFPKWEITDPNNYALQYRHQYVTEKNRDNVKNGDILILTKSAVNVANDIVHKLEKALVEFLVYPSITYTRLIFKGLPEEKTNFLRQLKIMAKDITFATEFINVKGIELLIRCIKTDEYVSDELADILVSFDELMYHGLVLWQNVESTIVRTIVRFLTQKNVPEIVEAVLKILDNIVQNTTNPESIDIKFDTLLEILKTSYKHEQIQQNTIALINSLFQKANDQRKTLITQKFSTEKVRDVLNSAVLKKVMRTELLYQLYVLQTLLLSALYGKQMMTAFDNTKDHSLKVQELKRIAFPDLVNNASEIDSLQRPSKARSKIRNKLGFKSEFNIEESFKKTPPGVLPLDCLLYFARIHSSAYKKIITEINSTSNDHEFPLGEASIELTKLLCDLLRIGEPPSEQDETFSAIFFSDNYPLYELFCICIQVLNQTWKDMKATNEDFNQVFSVAREQISRTFLGQPSTLFEFKRIIKTLPYSKITQLREESRVSREEYESTVPSIVLLKQKLTPHILKMIRNQRLNYLVEGSRFHHYGNKGQRIKDKYWYARLSKNYKILHYGDCDEEAVPMVEQLDKQININDIKQLLVEKECPIAKRKGQTVIKRAFAIVYLDQTYQPCEPLEFIAPDELTQNYWIDGLSALLNLEMPSSSKYKDLETLMTMEIKLRLLDTDGVEIDKNEPAIPPDPEDYNF